MIISSLAWNVMIFGAFLAQFFTAYRGAPQGVEVVKHEQVGVYDVHVIRGFDANAVVEWLQNGGFHFEDRDEEVFERYVEKGWYFVAARVGSDSPDALYEASFEGLVAPLLLRFHTPDAIYPLALTATTGERTQILIYLLSDRKFVCDDRLEMAYAGEIWDKPVENIAKNVKPSDFFSDSSLSLKYMTKFRGTLSSREMEDDLLFRAALDNENVREHVFAW